MKFLTSVLLTLLTIAANATNYYVSSKGNNSNDGTSPSKAWQTLVKVESAAEGGIIKAGDSILFQKGDVFTGYIKWATLFGHHFPTGTADKPIVFATYGEGNMPIFQYPKESNAKAEDRVLFWFVGVDYIVIDGFRFRDADTVNNKITPANCGVPIYLGAVDDATTNHCSIKNIDVSFCGMGVVIVGDFNTVTNSSFTNFKNLKSTPNTGGMTAYEDYGANGITITGNDNEISHNYISSAWAESLDFGWNGGAIEMYNNCSRNKIIHNNIIDCNGVAEYGAQVKGAIAVDNLFAYNMITNCGMLSYCNLNDKFSIQVSNIQYFNNKIVENNNSRFSGPKTGEGITTPGPRSLIKPDAALFAFQGNPPAKTVFNLRDNSFDLSTGIDVARKDNDAKKYEHENNIYRMSAGETNYDLNFSETKVGADKKP
ncbi:MAG: hypothetical protein QM737_20630 [Ferruginibacter sp.]